MPPDAPRAWMAPDAPAEPPVVATAVADAAGASRRPGGGPSGRRRPGRPGVPAVPVPLRPLTSLDIIDGAIGTIKAAPAVILGITAVVVVPIQLLLAWLRRDATSTDWWSALDDASTPIESGETALAWVLTALALTVVAAAVAVVVSAWYVGRGVDARAALAGALRRTPALVVAWIVVHVVEAIGTLFFVVPGLLAMAAFLVVTPVIALEGAGPIAALRRSVALTRTHLGSVLGVGVLVALVDGILTFGITGIGALVGSQSWAWIVTGSLDSVAALVTTPFVAAATVLVYLDLRIRTEALDLELGLAKAFPHG